MFTDEYDYELGMQVKAEEAYEKGAQNGAQNGAQQKALICSEKSIRLLMSQKSQACPLKRYLN